jgi:hypothetical protein
VAYDKAIREDGSLLFPRKLSKEFLDRQRKIQGSYIFAHQYLNEIIPGDDQDFKKEWLIYYKELPRRLTTVVVIDPAISLDQAACYTSIVALSCDENNHRYLRMAKRMRITATQTVDMIFKVWELLKPDRIGIESVAYQKALIQFTIAEMRKRQVTLPLHDIKRGPDKSKPMRIRSLVPWFEWQNTSVKPGLKDFEDEYLKFPRGTYVDILDALADAQEIIYPPEKLEESTKAPPPNHPDYEKWYIRNQLLKKRQEQEELEESA